MYIDEEDGRIVMEDEQIRNEWVEGLWKERR